MDERVLRHREEGKALLLREEAQLEQGRGDLLELSRQLEELLRRRDRLEVSKLLGPLASRLDRIGGELRTTGQVVTMWKNTKSKKQSFRQSSTSCSLFPYFYQRARCIICPLNCLLVFTLPYSTIVP